MVRSNWLVAVVSLDLVHLHELMQLGFGVLNRPVAVDASVHIKGLGLLHLGRLLGSVQVALRPKVASVISIITNRAIGLSKILRAVTLAENVCALLPALMERRYRRRRRCSIAFSATISTLGRYFTGVDLARANQEAYKVTGRIAFSVLFVGRVAGTNIRLPGNANLAQEALAMLRS